MTGVGTESKTLKIACHHLRKFSSWMSMTFKIFIAFLERETVKVHCVICSNCQTILSTLRWSMKSKFWKKRRKLFKLSWVFIRNQFWKFSKLKVKTTKQFKKFCKLKFQWAWLKFSKLFSSNFPVFHILQFLIIQDTKSKVTERDWEEGFAVEFFSKRRW